MVNRTLAGEVDDGSTFFEKWYTGFVHSFSRKIKLVLARNWCVRFFEKQYTRESEVHEYPKVNCWKRLSMRTEFSKNRLETTDFSGTQGHHIPREG